MNNYTAVHSNFCSHGASEGLGETDSCAALMPCNCKIYVVGEGAQEHFAQYPGKAGRPTLLTCLVTRKGNQE